jgi:RNA polymerase sigma-70 factor (ECF subfamily)
MNSAAHLQARDAAGQNRDAATDAAAFPVLKPVEEQRLAHMLSAHFESVWRVGRHMGLSSAQAEENAQEAYAIAARRLNDIESGRERAFLLGVASRLAINTRRLASQRIDRAPSTNETELPTTTTLPDELLARKQERLLLESLLQSLPEDFRQVITLFEIEELTLPEIAAALEIPLGTATSRLRRARDEFNKKLSLHAKRTTRGELR